MRTIRTKVYQFSELSKSAKEKAMEWYRLGNDYYFLWDDQKEDAKEIGVKLISLDDHRANEGEFMLSAHEVAANIIRDHGNECETYKTAQSFLDTVNEIQGKYEELEGQDYEDEMIEAEEEFLKSLLEDYRIMLNNDIDYQNSDEAVIESITINKYEFKADGTRF
jgi:hypothetical protein